MFLQELRVLTAEEKRVLRKNLMTYEGAVDHMYLDTRGNVTVGVGHLIRSAQDAQQLPFHKRNDTQATASEIQDEFESLRKLPYGQAHSAGYYSGFAQLRLRQSSIDSLTDTHIQSFEVELKRLYPAFDSYPTEARLALFDMIFNLGMTRLRALFPRFNQAVLAQDSSVAARECNRPGIQVSRNRYVQELFARAAAASAAVEGEQ